MARIYVPVSGGLESTRLLEIALAKQNFEVIPVYMNIGNNTRRASAEIVAITRILDWFKDHPEKMASGTKLLELRYFLETLLPTFGSTGNSNTAPITQQINLAIMGMLTRAADSINNPSFLIGWIKEDSFDESDYCFDYSTEEYKELASINTVLARIGFYDRAQRPHSLPLWDKKKIDIYHELDERLRDLIIPNPDAETITYRDDHVTFSPSEGKAEEYSMAGIPIKDSYSIPYQYGKNFVVDFLTERLPAKISFEYPEKYRNVVFQFIRNLKLSSTAPAFESNFKERFLHQISCLSSLKEETQEQEENIPINIASP